MTSKDTAEKYEQYAAALKKGSWMQRFKGRGKPHKRFFSMNAVSGIVKWGHNESLSKSKSGIQITTCCLLFVMVLTFCPSADLTGVLVGVDYPNKSKFGNLSFGLVSRKSTFDVAAFASEDYHLWTEGLSLILAHHKWR
jgi:hypothetical protein